MVVLETLPVNTMNFRDILLTLGLGISSVFGCSDNNVPYEVPLPPRKVWHDYKEVTLEMGEKLGRNTPVLSYDDLSHTLFGGTIDGGSYYSTISLGDSGQPHDLFWLTGSDGAEMIQGENERDVYGNYLFCDSDELIMVGTLTFSPPFEDYVEDGQPVVGLHQRMLNYMDDIYTIRSATRNGDGLFMEWVAGGKFLMDENSTAIITETQHEEYSRYYLDPLGYFSMYEFEPIRPPLQEQYEVELLIVSPGSLEAKYRINGEITDALSPGEFYTLADGTRIMQDFITQSPSGVDQAAFYWDADIINIADADITDGMPSFFTPPYRNGEGIEDAVIRINGQYDGNNLELRSIEWGTGCDAVLGEMFIGEGQSLREHLDEPEGIPGRRLDIAYLGSSGNTHTVRVGSILGMVYDIDVQD